MAISTPILLLRAIKEFIQQTVEGDVQMSPSIHVGYLPQRNKDNLQDSEFPFILVRPGVGEDQQDNSKVTIKLIFGAKAEDDEGFMDLLNTMEQIRIALLRKRIINNRFKLELPYKWEFFDEQPYPEWYGIATTVWTLPSIQEEVEGL
ncbi:hypothetical protein [Paenibacillus wynnii]|uniref:hypothetical protein n=1 Tax=Paenibacillus wynnii TaxID=268407 RepID=UPI00068CFA6D|nr:hypothetical protein [Paenibacillus wynnii]